MQRRKDGVGLLFDQAYRVVLDSARLTCLTCLGLNIKYWTSPDLNAMRWLGLFTNKTFRKHRKSIFPHRDFIIWLHLHSSLANFHPHFVIGIFPSAFYHPHFSIPILSSAFFYPPSAIRSALYRDPRWLGLLQIRL